MRGLIILIVATLFIGCTQQEGEGIITLKIPANQINSSLMSSADIMAKQISGEMIPDELVMGLDPDSSEPIKDYALEADLLTPDETPIRMFYTLKKGADCIPSINRVCVTKGEDGSLNIAFVLYAAVGKDRGLLVALRGKQTDDRKPAFFLGAGMQLDIKEDGFNANLILKPITTVKGKLIVDGKPVAGTLSPYSAIPHDDATMEGDTVVRLRGTTEVDAKVTGYDVPMIYNQLQNDFRLVENGQIHSKNSFNMMLKAQSGDRYGVSIPAKMNHYRGEILQAYNNPQDEGAVFKEGLAAAIEGALGLPGDRVPLSRERRLLLDYLCFNRYPEMCALGDGDKSGGRYLCFIKDTIKSYCESKQYHSCDSSGCDVPEAIGDLYPGAVINNHNIYLKSKKEIITKYDDAGVVEDPNGKRKAIITAINYTRYGRWAKDLFKGYNNTFMVEKLNSEEKIDLNNATRVGNIFLSGFNFLVRAQNTSDLMFQVQYKVGDQPICLHYRGPVTVHDMRSGSFQYQAEDGSSRVMYGELLQTTYPFYRTIFGECSLKGTKATGEPQYQGIDEVADQDDLDRPEISSSLKALPEAKLEAIYICGNPGELGACLDTDIFTQTF